MHLSKISGSLWLCSWKTQTLIYPELENESEGRGEPLLPKTETACQPDELKTELTWGLRNMSANPPDVQYSVFLFLHLDLLYHFT